MNTPKIRCLLAMLGTDVHSKGIRTLASLLRDQGIEVIYLGEHNTAGRVVNAAIAEDVDIVGLSFSTATYSHCMTELMQKMKEAELDSVAVMVGGLIHPDDKPALNAMGVKGVFGPGSTTEEVLDFIRDATGKPVGHLKPV